MKRIQQTLTLAAVLALSSALGCAGQEGDSQGATGGKGDFAGTGAWRARVDQEVARLKKEDPTLWRSLTTVEALPTRAGFTRLRGELVRHPVSASVFLSRYLEERDGEARAALVEALPRTGGVYADALVELIDSEPDDATRAAMIDALGGGESAAALHGIAKGLADQALSVRLEAAVVAGRSKRGAELGSQLTSLLADPAPAVRAAAARALGVHAVASASTALSERLADDDANVRLQALRALSRIDADALASNPALASLARDRDERVRRVALSVTHDASR